MRLCQEGADRHEIKPNNEAQPGKALRVQPRQYRKEDNGGSTESKDDAHDKQKRSCIGLIGSGPEQQNHDRGNGYREVATRPGGDSPAQCDRADDDKGTSGSNKSRQPVGHTHPDDAGASRGGTGRFSNEQGHAVQRLRQTRQRFGCLV